MKHEVLVAVDVGLKGGIAFFDIAECSHPSHGLLSLLDMPTSKKEGEKSLVDLERLVYILERPKIRGETAIVAFENIHSFGNSGFGVGKIMEEKGMLRGITKALGYDELMVAPQTWQRHFKLVPPKDLKGSTAMQTRYKRRKWIKENSILTAGEKFPDWIEQLKTKTCDGLSDALLLGLWYLETPLD
jgi:hypothetical protein